MPVTAGLVAIVDDDPFILHALSRALTSYGYRVKTYGSAELYLAKARAEEIMCAVLDIDLGRGMSGLELGRQIAASAHPAPIVFMSGSVSACVRARALAIGCLEFLAKPFLTERLVGIIMRFEGQDPV